MIEKTCEICDKAFNVKPYRMASARFCSKACGGVWHMRNRVMLSGHMTGNTFRKGLRPSNAFPAGNNKGVRLIQWEEFTCENCKCIFERPPWIARQNKNRYCSLDCKHSHCIGSNDPRFIGGPKTYRGRGWKAQRLLAVKRDHGRCVDCKTFIGISISVHHIVPYRDFESPETANQLSNLECLCQSCHMKKEPAVHRPSSSPLS